MITCSSHALPEHYRKLMYDPASPIIDFYPIGMYLMKNGVNICQQIQINFFSCFLKCQKSNNFCVCIIEMLIINFYWRLGATLPAWGGLLPALGRP